MRIRSQLVALAVASLTIGLLAITAVFSAARQEAAADEVQERAQLATHEVAGLLILTQEYARYAEPRAAEQWHHRQAAIASALNTNVEERLSGAALTEFRAAVAALPPLFARLEQIPHSDDAFAQRRKEALLDQLLTNTQAMSDYAYQWFQDTAALSHEAERRFQLIAITVPCVLVALLLATAWLVSRRVLLPMQRLEDAAAAIGAGDMSFRIASTSRDEIGDLSRQFDTMTLTLLERSDQVRRSGEQLREITDNLPALVGYINQEHRYEFANGKYREWWHLDPACMVGSLVSEVMGEATHDAIGPSIAKALAGERAQWTGASSRSGREAHYLAEYIPDIAADGTVRGCYALVIDITERNQAEMRVARSEERLVRLMNNIPAMVGYFDMQERCEYANDMVLRSQGIERADLPGLPLRDVMGESTYAQHALYIQEVLQGRRARFQGVIPFRGRQSHFQAHVIPDRPDGGEQRGFYLMTFDVTALKEAQLQQTRVEARLRAVTDNLPVLITYLDDGLHFRFVNQTFQTWLGLDPAAAIGKHASEVTVPEHFEQRRAYLERALTGERVTFEIQSVTQGVTRTLQNTYIPDIQPDGRVVGIYTLSTDVSVLKNAEQKLSLLVRMDTLTGLANRYQFNEALPIALARSARSGNALSVMFLDIDHFKSINDSLGHAAGDQVLREFAHRLQDCVRSTDSVARLAGDEFVIILEGLGGVSETELVARKILARINVPFEVEDRLLNVTTSIGIAYHATTSGPTSADDLLAQADEALYAAKRAGRNTFHVSPDMQQARRA